MTFPSFPAEGRHAGYWRRIVRLSRRLLLAWFACTFVVIYFARELTEITLFGWPLSYYMAAQGIVLVYLVLIAIYAWSARQLEKQSRSAPHE